MKMYLKGFRLIIFSSAKKNPDAVNVRSTICNFTEPLRFFADI